MRLSHFIGLSLRTLSTVGSAPRGTPHGHPAGPFEGHLDRAEGMVPMKDQLQSGESTLRSVRTIYSTFGPHIKTYWKWFLFAYMGLLGTVLMNLIKPWPLKLIFDYILLDKPLPDTMASISTVVSHNSLALLTIICVGIVLLAVFESLFSYTNKYFIAAAGHSMINDVRQRVFE